MEENQQKGSNSSQQLPSLKNYLIFLGLTVAIVNVCVMAFSWWLVLLGIIWSVRIVCTKQLRLGLSCFFVALISFLFFCGWRLREEDTLKNILYEDVVVKLRIDPLSFVIRGDYLRFDGEDSLTKNRYRLNYQLESEAERDEYVNMTELKEVELSVRLKEVSGQRNLNGFDYQDYLVKEGIYYYGEVLKQGSWQRIKQPTLKSVIVQMRCSLRQSFLKRLPEPLGSHLSSLVLGVKDDTLKENQYSLKVLGLNQLISLSGLQIIYFNRVMTYLLRRLGLTLETIFICQLSLFSFLFVFYWGMGVSLLRSIIYLSFKTINYEKHWGFSALDIWSFTLICVLVIRPYALFQIGGQLSFGLTFYWHHLKHVNAEKMSGKLKKMCLGSVLALPILAYHFQQWHLLSLFLSSLFLPLYLYLIWPSLIISWLLTFVFTLEEWLELLRRSVIGLTNLLIEISQIKTLNMITGSLPVFILIASVILSIIFLVRYQQKNQLSLLILALLLGLPLTFKYLNPEGLVAFVDVGQGESTFIQLPFQRGNILIDTGGSLNFPKESWAVSEIKQSNASLTLMPFLKSRGVTELDYLFLTHAHADHIGDLREVADEIKIKKVIYPAGMEEESAFKSVLEILNQRGTVGRGVLRGEQWQMGEVGFQSLAPGKSGLGTNEDSLVISFSIKNQRFLQVGDLEKVGEENLIKTYTNLTHDVLSAGHHGSRTSSTLPFIAAVSPKVALISAGKNNLYGHPHLEVLENFSQYNVPVYRTDENGMIYYTWLPWNKKLSEAQTVK